MPPRVHLVRHGQGYHQLDPLEKSRQIHDPSLTDLGFKRCKGFNEHFPEYVNVDLVCASPLRRTIQTASNCFHDRIPRTSSHTILLLPLAQETTTDPCDVGSDVEIIKQEFGDLIDTSMVKGNWTSKQGVYACTPEAIIARAREVRLWLRARPENDIVVVAHGAFNDYMTGAIREDGLLLSEFPSSAVLLKRASY